MWDDWNAGDEDPMARERVEMSFESVRLEKYSPRGLPIGASSMRSVSGQSGAGISLVGTSGMEGWMSPASVSKGGFNWS